ncbi:MAG TPA: murein biosynthesis integral membrane protein MurJ [Solirubrobacteraceae bacterium]
MSAETKLTGGSPPSAPPPPPRRRLALSTTIFAAATAVSRVAGLGREIVQASFFATGVAITSFTIASQIPNLVANLFSQAALSAAFVPVFTQLLHEDRKPEAVKLASELFWLILIGLGVLTLVWMAVAGLVMPLFTGTHLDASATALTAGLSRVLFPVVLLLSITGLLVGILQAYDEFTVPAIAPAVWNVVIIVLLVVLHAEIHGQNSIYAYAIAWLVATVVQMLMIASALRRIDFRLSFSLSFSDPRIREVMILFVPVTISIGIINLDAFINAELGTLVNSHAPSAINDAFRLYMLPQGVFSVAVATVLFPTLSRMAVRRDPSGMRRTLGNGIRQINLLMIPSAGLIAVLANPITQLVYEHGRFHAIDRYYVSTALFWFAFSLPFAGVNLLCARTFFALRRPWIPTRLAVMNIAVDILVSLALYKPLGIAGLIIGTLAANLFMTWLQMSRLRIGFNGRLEGAQTTMITARIVIASAVVTALGYLVWRGLHGLFGVSLIAQILAVGVALSAAGLLYARLVLLMRIPEARQIEALIAGRLRGRAAG